MRYRMLTSVGSSEGWAYGTGQIVLRGDAYTKDTVLGTTLDGWVRAGIAEPVLERIAPEAAVLPEPVARGKAPETATIPAAPKGRKSRR